MGVRWTDAGGTSTNRTKSPVDFGSIGSCVVRGARVGSGGATARLPRRCPSATTPADHRTAPSDEEPSADEPIRLVIVESRELLGIGIREVLDNAPGIEIVGQVQSPDEAMSVIDAAAPDVVLVDVPQEADAADAVRRMHQGAPDSPLVVLGGEDDDASIIEAMEVGATAHVAEVAEPAELVATIRRVAEGEDPLKDELIARPDLVERILDNVRDTIMADRESTNPLTTRELGDPRSRGRRSP